MKICTIFAVLLLFGCNSVYVNGTMEPNSIVHAKPLGYGMKRALKEQLQNRGYDVRVGKLRKLYGETSERETLELPWNTKYVVRIDEKEDIFMPWCVFNGFWWWRFSLSIADQQSGKEILSWRGRGCQNSSLRKLNEILNELENKKEK